MKKIPRFNSCDLLNQEDLTQDFVIFDLQQILTQRNNIASVPHKHLFYQLLFITKGEGEHFIDFQTYHVKKGDLFFLNPGQVHKWDFNSSTNGFIINFTEDFISSFLSDNHFLDLLPFFSNTSNQDSILYIENHYSTILNIFDKINFEIHLQKDTDLNLVRVYLLELFLLCKKHYFHTDNFSYNQLQPSNLVKQFEFLVEKHFYKLRFPKEYAELLCVTPNYLNSICQKIRGQSAGELIRSRILLESKRLLVNTDLSASEIAYKLSFKDNSYFSRFFKKHTGIAPDEYRKS